MHKDQGHRPPVNIFMGVPTMYAKLADHCQESLTSQERESAKDHLQSRVRLACYCCCYVCVHIDASLSLGVCMGEGGSGVYVFGGLCVTRYVYAVSGCVGC